MSNLHISQSQVLPSNVLRLISEYSKPLTRPNWRTLRKMTSYKLYNISMNVIRKKVNLVLIFQENIKDTLWYKLYGFTQCWGIEQTSRNYEISVYELLKIDGIAEAIEINKYRANLIRMKRQYGFI
uniref:Uncharacterized protein n=1 Tax=viral metagenome TaxID=1070528 RepID=A0A6C0JKJ1_9ZZZZ